MFKRITKRSGRRFNRGRKFWEKHLEEVKCFKNIVHGSKLVDDQRIVRYNDPKIHVEEREKARLERQKMKEQLEECLGWKVEFEEFSKVMEDSGVKAAEAVVRKLEEELAEKKEKLKKEEEKRRKEVEEKKEEEKRRKEMEEKKRKEEEEKTKEEDKELRDIFAEMILDTKLVHWLEPEMQTYKLIKFDEDDEDVIDIRQNYMDIEE